MKPHVATLALVGWYLMAPPAVPVGQGMLAWDSTAPLSEWQILYSYDSAADCQAMVKRKLNSAYSRNHPNAERWASQFLCIASDDARLKQK